jgi:RHS repeat-associated protein
MRSRRIIQIRSCLLKLVMILAMLTGVKPGFAAEEPYVNNIRGAGVVPGVVGTGFMVTDEKFLNSTVFYNTIRPAPYSLEPENIVELKLNYDTSLFFYDKIFTATVNLTILCYNNAYDTSQVFTQYNNINLTIKHDSTKISPYKGVHFIKFSGAYKFRVIINSVTCPELGAAMPPVLIVEGKTVIKRKYNFSATSSDVTKIQELTGPQIKLTWIPSNYAGAELYDLEYTVVDDSSGAGASIRSYLQTSTPIPAVFMERLFRSNASRITTAASEYVFNPMYRAGYLLFRIRGVQFANEYQESLIPAEQNLRTEGNWNYLASKLSQPSYQYNVVQLQWHEPNLNWQYTISFAEEGKRNELMGYFDGILKNRQNVTLNNTSKKTVIQETIYDALGRSGVSVLPAPINDSIIHYYANFNQNKNNKGYSYKDFSFGAACRTIPDTMKRTTGSHQYYSSNNNINDYFFKKYIPQAEGYPFAVTEYTPDNTGRIFAQSGVGKDFQPGTNHETKYFYSKPTQEELDRLFGSEAGNASHYLKNMMVDPNGQISVTYMNSTGKTVATGLAGLTPPNVEGLSTNNGTGVDVKKTLMVSQDFTRDYAANALLGNSSFSAVISGNYKFIYDLTPLRLDVLHGSSNQFKICNTCYYDLLITVRDNCNTVLHTVSRPVDVNQVFSTDCVNPPPPIADSFIVSIANIGDYSVQYSLAVSERAWAYYDSVHLAQNTNIRPFNSFLLEKLNNADFKGCFSDCATCIADLGTKTDFINNKIKPLFIQADSIEFTATFDTWAGQLYDSLLANCNAIQAGCNTGSPCDEEKLMLLDDVKPGGQYSPYDPATYLPTELTINIMYNYRHNVIYYNEDGSPGTIEYNGVVYPANSTSIPWKDFIENFQDSWAEALLPYHPEYCFYQWCLYGSNPTSKAFDNEVTDLDDDAVATTKGYFGSSYLTLLWSDPFFLTGEGSPWYMEMYDSLTNFSGTIPGYNGAVLNIKQYIDFELYCEEAGVTQPSCTVPAPGAACRSPYVEWQLYKEYYLNLKTIFQEKARLANFSFFDCRNCYIGTDFTDILFCTPPPASDFTIQLDPTYTTGKRLIIKYKNGQTPVPHSLELTIAYNYGSTVVTFRSGMSTELFVVPASAGDYYAISSVQCKTYSNSGGGSKIKFAEKNSGLASPNELSMEAGDVVNYSGNYKTNFSCPCPTWSDFSVNYYNGYCWDGTDQLEVNYTGLEIPVGRTVYVQFYYMDYNTWNSGTLTVTFTGSQTYSYACVPGVYNWGSGNYSLFVENVWCDDGPSFICPSDGISSVCPEDPLYPFYKDKIRRYNSYQNPHNNFQQVVNNSNYYTNQNYDELANSCQANCEAMADSWINSIKCPLTPTQLESLRASLINVCKSGCSQTNLFGASENSSLTQSFESVIRSFVPASSDSCTAELISEPYPYYKQPQYQSQQWIRVDNCLTSRWNQLYAQYQTAVTNGYVGTFHDWLKKQLKNDYTLTSAEFTALQTAVTNTCKYLKKPLQLPVVFNCSNTAGCVDSATVVQMYAAFLVKYPGITAANQYYERLLTNYFNHNLGFALNFEDYNIYIQKCQTGTTNKDLLCNRTVGSNLVVQTDVMQCMVDVFNLAVAQAQNEYIVYIDSVRTAFRNAYMSKCLNAQANLFMRAKLYEYHYTLYYYDQAGNLVKTIPPQGVDILTDQLVAQVQQNRVNTNNYCYSNAPELVFNANIMTMNRELSYDPTAIDGKYSLEAWVKFGNLTIGGNNGIFSYNDYTTSPNESGWAFIHKVNKLSFRVGLSPNKLEVETPVLSTFLTAGTWYHIVINVNNANPTTPVRIFINGNNVPLTYLNNYPAYYYVFPSHNHKLKIGASFDNGTTTAVVNTGIKQFRWYQRELSVPEIQQNGFNNCFTPMSTSGMISYVPVIEGTGNVLEDRVTYNVSTISGNGTAVWSNYIAGYYPRHQYPTTYIYNTFNQVTLQNSPDAGTATFYYDVLGRLVASQNSEQKTPKNTANSSAGRFSYTKYDPLGRINEVGEKYTGGTLTFDDIPGSYDTKNASSLNNWYNTGTDKQLTMTIYDQPNTSLVTFTGITNLQNINTRKRVVATVYKELKSNNYYDFATHYVYDISGNVKTIFQDLKPMRDVEMIIGPQIRGVRQMDYVYDHISGKVNRMIYQKGKGDQFIYRYDYDAENRVTDAYTSRNGLLWQRDAHYYYYLHGPLARIEMGKYQVQGIDYAYTLQGWMKGINSQALDVTKDMAGDGDQANLLFKKFGRDVYGFSLGYHSNDYKPIGTTTAPAFEYSFTAPTPPIGTSGNTGAQLYNGNIGNSTLALSKINSGQTTGYSHLYDQLNRLTATRQHTISGTTWNFNSYNAGYEERASYDANGNIKTYVRKGAGGSQPTDMDNLKYWYYYTTTSSTRAEFDPTQPLPGNVRSLSNQLAHVDDAVAYGNYASDIDDQNASNFDYDNIGNLIKDDSSKITSINWTVFGKIKQIVKSTGVTINFGYDPAGNRVVKEVTGDPGGGNYRHFYIRDPQGQLLAIYKDQFDYVDWVEQHLYGSSRLGIWNYGKYTPGLPLSVTYDSMMVGSVNYELSNHLTNVLSTISDKKVGVSAGGSVVDYYNAVVLTQNDYYPFGMLMPGRQYTAQNNYRYGFNGKENDNDVKGTGNSLDFGGRIYDSRIGRWLSVDPRAKDLPSESPYIFGGDNPILMIDPDGKFKIGVHKSITKYALSKLPGRLSRAAKLDIIVWNTYVSDLMGANTDWHFDGRNNFDQIQAVWKGLNEGLKELKDDFGWGNRHFGGPDAQKLGVMLHTVQDFYAHSNYVELYIQYYQDTHDGDVPDISNIPLYEDALNDAKFTDEYLKPKLKTGEFDVFDYIKGKDKEKTNKRGETHHDEIAKDKKSMGKTITSKDGKKSINTHDAAVDAAKRKSEKVVKDVVGE